jgi:phosphate transport system substrate-binding protein
MKKLLFAAVPLLALGYFLVPKSNAQTRYLVTGSSTVAPILQKVAEALQAEDSSLRIDVETGGSGRGIQDAQSKQSDLGMASRDLEPEELKDVLVRPIAFDGIAMIVHESNPLKSLTKQQVIDIYTGKITDWKDVGAQPGEIYLVSKAEGRATLTVFLEHFKLKSSDIPANAIVGDNAQGVRLVTGNAAAIAYVSIGEALAAVERGEKLHLVGLDGIEATEETVADGSYPLRRNLNLVFPGAVDPLGERILAYLASPAGSVLLGELGFTPIVAQ